ncbi:MAG: tRNA (adenosine(37)-N6)-threonylcarbamoyltransferase complex ATPase subunit type 1 TsaE [Nitrospirales bacterium]|nr:MAG: tRNA (adenosine(37)-N6)-threonylcarbamoyltransferase complex ATPase subunit type 1 TsaE [Nitrospirales bacterium]
MNTEGNIWTTRLPSVHATESLGHRLGQQLTGGEIIALRGELGAGKTVFVRGLASGILIDSAMVTSPTFTLIHEYHGRLHLIHADLYRLELPQEWRGLGLQEYFYSSSVVVIEWAERMEKDLPPDRLDIHLEHRQRSSRNATLRATGPHSRELVLKIAE